MSQVSRARNLGKYFLLIDNILVVLGFFVAFPLISIRFVDQIGWTVVMIGIALGLRQFIQQGLGIFGGAIANRFGAKPMIVTGMLTHAAGFVTMGVAHEPWLLRFSYFLSRLGGTLFDPPRSALVVKLIRPEKRRRFFSILMIQDSVGAVTGALLGSQLLQYDFRPACATGAILFVLCAALNAWLLPAWKLSTVKIPVREGMSHVVHDKHFVTYVLTLAGYYILAVQVMLMLPIMVNGIAGSPAAVEWMYAIEACLSLTLFYPIAHWDEKRFRLEHRLMVGLLVMSLSMIPTGLVGNLQQLFALICTFYIGSIVTEPARETLSTSLANARTRGSYIGFSRLGLAIDGAIGYIDGGWLFNMGKALAQPELPWTMLGIIGLITFPALGWQFSLKRPTKGMLEPNARQPNLRPGAFQFFLLASGASVFDDALCHDYATCIMSRNPMKKPFFAAALIISGLLVDYNRLTRYTVSEQEINQALAKHNNFSKDIGLSGVAEAHIVLNNLTSQIGRGEPNKVTLTGDANLDMNSLFGSQKATTKLKLKTLPVFNKEKGVIYLQEMEVVDTTVTPEKMQSVLQTLTPYLNQSLRNYFNQQPAYTLQDDSSQGEALAKKLTKGIKVKPGEIIIPFTD